MAHAEWAIRNDVDTEASEDEHEPLKAYASEGADKPFSSRQQLNAPLMTFPEECYTHSEQVKWKSIYDFLTACGLECRLEHDRSGTSAYSGRTRCTSIASPNYGSIVFATCF